MAGALIAPVEDGKIDRNPQEYAEKVWKVIGIDDRCGYETERKKSGSLHQPVLPQR